MVGKSLPLGSYTYRVVASGFNISEGRLTLTDKSSMHIEPVTLNPTGILSVTSQPKGAKLFLNGKQKGRTPFNQQITTGNYELKLELSAYKSVKDSIRMNPDENKNLNYTLTERPFLKHSTAYLFVPFIIGTNNFFGISPGIGAYIHNFNIEIDIPWHFRWKYYCYNTGGFSGIHTYTEGFPGIDMKLGYGFILWHHFRITPQFWYSFIRYFVRADYYGNIDYFGPDMCPIHAFTIGARMELAIAHHIGFFLTPIGQLRIKNETLNTYTNIYTNIFERTGYSGTFEKPNSVGKGFYVQMGFYFSI